MKGCYSSGRGADRLYVGDYYESKPLREKSTRTLAYGNTYGKIDG